MYLKIIKKILLFTAVFLLSFTVANAADITESVTIDGISKSSVFDRNLYTHDGGENITFTVTSTVPMQGIYIKYNSVSRGGMLNTETPIGTYGFLHEYIELNGAYEAVFSYEFADICDISVYDMEELPADVQRWSPIPEGVDILLLATHSDDDQLFFAGLLPLYASRENVSVAVAYFINHYDTYNRTHELLDGLWHCGIKFYPEISPFPDAYSTTIEEAKSILQQHAITDEDVTAFHTKLLENYKPLVVVLHDFNGEYGHGAHKHSTQSFLETVQNSSGYVPQKIYVHLYSENTITLDIDTPLDYFDGKSAFNVSQEAFGFHLSQHWTWFYSWLYGTSKELSDGENFPITKSTQINSYNPAEYGLYFTSVGSDSGQNDMLENIVTYAEQYEQKKQSEAQEEDKSDDDITCGLKPDDTEVTDNPPSTPDTDNGKEFKPIYIAFLALFIVIVIIIISLRKKK